MKKTVLLIALISMFVSSCMSEEEKQFRASVQQAEQKVDVFTDAYKTYLKTGSARDLQILRNCAYDDGMYLQVDKSRLSAEMSSEVNKWKARIDSLQMLVDDLTREHVRNHYKLWANGEILVESKYVVPMYLKRGTALKIDYTLSAPAVVKLYNADAQSVLKSYSAVQVKDSLIVPNTAIYLYEVSSKTPVYCNLQLCQSVDSLEELLKQYNFNVTQIESEAGGFRSTKVPGVNLVPVFEEPHKYTLRSRLKYIWDMTNSNRSVAAVSVPSGTSDILYHLRISTVDSGRSSDGEFFSDVYTKYKKVKFLGLPLYESTKTHNTLFRELLNSLTVEREENAYCNLYVFDNSSQAKKFQSNVDVVKLSYDLDNSAQGTQSRNERIHLKPGTKTIYLGFENTRQRYDVYLWVEVIASVKRDVYYTEKYSLTDSSVR